MNKYDSKLHEIGPQPKELPGAKVVLPVPPSLQPYIEGCFELNQQQGNGISMILPDLSPHIVAYKCKGQDQYRLSLVGPRSKAVLVNRRPRFHTLIIRFKPTALPFFMKDAIHTLKDSSFPVQSVLKSFSADQDLTEVSLRDHFTRLISPAPVPLSAAQLLSRAYLTLVESRRGQLKVKEAANKLGCSDRYLRKSMAETTGMSPLFAIRLERMRQSFLFRQQFPLYNWSDIAHLSGYYDHAHMVEEYQALLKQPPSRLFRFFQGE